MRAWFWILAALAAVPAVPAAAQQSLDRPGTVSHRSADAHFPERVGEFQRGSVTQYDRDGEDISASYELNRGDGRLLITVYVYPGARMGGKESGGVDREALCNREFEDARNAISSQNRGARIVESGAPPAIADLGPALARRSVYRFRTNFSGDEQMVRSELDLYCFVGGQWSVKYRATSNEGFDAEPEIERFIRTGPWPGRAPVVDPKDIAALSTGSTQAP